MREDSGAAPSAAVFAATLVSPAICGRRAGSGILPVSGVPAGRSSALLSFAADGSCDAAAAASVGCWLSELEFAGIGIGAGGVAACPAALLASATLADGAAGAAIAGAAMTGAAMVDGVERVAAKGGGGTPARAVEAGAGVASAGAALAG